jgi:hypothetical protein
MLTEKATPRRSYGRHPIVKTVSQVQLRLQRSGDDPFKTVQHEILDWIRRKAGKPLPKPAWDGLSFELDEVGAQRVAAAHLEVPRYWSARADDADRYVAQRTWITEIGLASVADGGVIFGCRLIVTARGDNPTYQPSIPVFVRDIVSGGDAYLDDRLLANEPWLVRTREGVEQLYDLMISPRRRADVCVFSLAENSDDPSTAAASVTSVHNKTLGAAHIVVLTGPAAFELTDIVGKEFSVFNRAVRTYRPGFDTDNDDNHRHPLAMANRIADCQENDVTGAEAFELFLARNAISQTVSGSDLEQLLPPFSEVRRVAATLNLDAAREAGASTEEMLKLYEDDNSKLRATLDEEKAIHAGLLTEADRERDDTQRRAEEARGEVFRLNLRIRTMEEQLNAKPGPKAALEVPSTFDGLKEWADRHLAGSVVIANRALRGAKESEYEDPSLAYRALLALRDHYVPMRRVGGDELSTAYAYALRELGVEDERSISESRLGEQGEDYVIQYNGKKRELERHLRKGNSREPRHCFRLYFFWDNEGEQAVVGWLTSHLETRQS